MKQEDKAERYRDILQCVTKQIRCNSLTFLTTFNLTFARDVRCHLKLSHHMRSYPLQSFYMRDNLLLYNDILHSFIVIDLLLLYAFYPDSTP